MQSGFRVGRIFGINIFINWSWLLIFVFLTWSLSTQIGRLQPEWGIALRWGSGIGAAILFFSSLLAHEMAHSLVARAKGIPVKRITLFLFGGVSNIQKEPSSPGDEFAIAVVGPITSFLIGFGFLIGVFLLPGGTGLNPLELNSAFSGGSTLLYLFGWLGTVNIIIGAFNLLPGFPLDGGRILRAVLWTVMDDLRSATKWASITGRGMAWVMIFAGIVMIFGIQIPILGTGITGGLWIVFIGWFLNNAAAQNYQKVVVDDILEDVPVQQLMRSDPIIVSSDKNVREMINSVIMDTDESSFPVVDDGVLKGVVTLDDLREVPQENWENVTVNEIMKSYTEIPTTTPETDASEAVSKLTTHNLRQIPVIDGNTLLGVLRQKDVVRWMQFQHNR